MPGVSGCCATAPGHRSPWTGCANPERLRYARNQPGPGGNGPLLLTPLKDLATEYDVSAERIRQIESKAMKTMRSQMAQAA